MPHKAIDLSFNTPEGRWARLGPYYAMFPIPFAERVITQLTKRGDTVIDPFCGRGTAPYLAMIYGRMAIACDINPVAWLYSKTKTDPYPKEQEVTERIRQIGRYVTKDDHKPENDYQRMAFCKRVLGFIRAASRTLKWRHNRLDRTVATVMIQHLQDKKGQGLSNQLRHSRAFAPDYSIRWWESNGHGTPPEVEPEIFLEKRVAWRYAKGTPEVPSDQVPHIALGDAATSLPQKSDPAKLVITSPPYSNVTNYRSDNWLRLWALGVGPNLPDWNQGQKFVNAETYRKMLKDSLEATSKLTDSSTVWYIRSDTRPRTKEVIREVMSELLPNYRAYEQEAPYKRKTQTALYGDSQPKPGEVDLLYMPPRCRRSGFTLEFREVR